MTTLSENLPQGCGCAACQAAARGELSSNYTGSATATVAEANSLYSGYRWGTGTSGITLAYKFFTALPSYYSSSDDESHNFQAFNTQMKAATGRVLAQIESFTNIDFVETTGPTTQLGFAQASLPPGVGAWAYYPSSHVLGGDVWTNNIYSQTQTPAEGNYGFYTLMHEIGHALGLQHSFTAGLTGDEASSRYSVMAYDWSPFFSSSYMVYDIAALQKIYGANMTYHTGNDVYTTASNLAYSIWDAGGNDTLSAATQTSNVTLDLREGAYSSVGMTRNIGIAFGAVIENATGGSGNDILIGNNADNVLVGNDGNDTFIASKGTDNVNGGSGSDLLVFDSILADFILSREGASTLSFRDLTGNYGTATVTDVETIQFAGTNYGFDALAAMATISGGYESLTTETLSVYSSFRSGKKTYRFWTDVTSSDESITNYQGDDFKYKFSDDLLTVGRSNNSGHDAIVVTAAEGIGSYVQAISMAHINTLEDLTFNRINNLTITDKTVTHDLDIHVNGGYSLNLSIGSGNDTIEISSTATGKERASYSIDAGSGNDVIHVSGTSSKMGTTISGGDGDDTVTIETVAGARVYGGVGNDVVVGGSGGDDLRGDAGDDNIHGGAGNDTLSGGEGNDVLYGGIGSDALVGGTGLDRFVIENASASERDCIKDFNAAEDVIDISAIISGYDPLTDAINDFVMTSYNKKTKATYLLVDTDGHHGDAGFMAIAQVNGLRGQDVDDLVQNGHLVIA